MLFFFFFSSRRRHTRWPRDWSSDVCSSDLGLAVVLVLVGRGIGSFISEGRGVVVALDSGPGRVGARGRGVDLAERSEEHTSELQSRGHLVCRPLLEKKKVDELSCWRGTITR